MSSEQLPEELLQQILWCLKIDVYSQDSADDNLAARMTLLSCMVANSTLHRLAEPVLYHSIQQRQLTRLVQRFVRRPGLASLVRELRDSEAESHERSTERLPDIQAWTEENIELCGFWGRPYEMPTIGLISLMCTRLETFVLERNDSDSTFPCGEFLAECTEWYQKSQNGIETPLGALRTFVMQPGPRYQDHISEFDDSWLPGLMFLPNIERIEIAELKIYDFELPDSTSNLRSLTIGSPMTNGIGTGYPYQFPVSIVLERLLVKCPLLHYMDLTFHSDPGEEDDYWDSPGYVLSNYGSSLRALHLHNPYGVRMPDHEGKPIDLVTMTNLRTLTLPVNAILPSRSSPRSTSISDPERQPNLIVGEYASSLIHDNSRDNEDRPGGIQGAEEGCGPAFVALMDIMPPNLAQLTIVDKTCHPHDVARLDWDLWKMIISPHFESLRAVRLQRDQTTNEQMNGPRWEVQRQAGCWKVSRRI
jgi:hypothetical protein